ncbi:MAG TPA: RNA-binding protein [Candidatus Hydrogenedentes bacterium]|nr:RNA-binding protein [Candidatus Hydrogenedentota bacterium]
MNIFVGNLSYDTRDSDLENLFAGFGTVESCRVIMDRDTRRSKGFGFVEMENASEAETAIAELDGTSLHDRTIKVNEAKPRENRPRR